MEATLRFRVAGPDRPGAPVGSQIVTITVEVGNLSQDLRDLILMHVATDIHKHDPLPGQPFLAPETIPLNRWSEDPMDICHGELTEAGIMARGTWEDINTFVPDLITAEVATLEGLVNAILEDQNHLLGEDDGDKKLENDILPGLPEDEPDDADRWKNE